MNEEWELLAFRHLNGTASREDILRIDRMLRDEAGFVDLVLRLAEEETLLRDVLGGRQVSLSIGAMQPAVKKSARVWRRAALPLAAAASIVFILGVSVVLRSVRSPETYPRIVRQTGQVTVSERESATGPGSYCLLQCKDASLIALDEQSTVRLSEGKAQARQTVEHTRGRIYLEVSKQAVPFVLRAANTQIEALGTKLLVQTGEETRATVLDGRIRVTRSGSGVYIGKGKEVVSGTATRQLTSPPYRRTYEFLRVTTPRTIDDRLSWLRQVGMEVDDLLSQWPRDTAQAEDSAVDFDDYRVLSGLWEIGGTHEEPIIKQERLTRQTALLFGRPKWRKGILSFRFRVLEKRGPEASVQVQALFFYENGPADSMGIVNALQGTTGWLSSRMEFEVGQKNNLIIRNWEIQAKGDTQNPWFKRRLEHTPENTIDAKRGPCGVGLGTENCAVEFKDLKLTEAELALSSGGSK